MDLIRPLGSFWQAMRIGKQIRPNNIKAANGRKINARIQVMSTPKSGS